MPDIANDAKVTHEQGTLEKVGMENIEFPIMLSNDRISKLVPANFDIFVSLNNSNVKGIHMSRLFLNAQKTFSNTAFSLNVVEEAHKELLKSHEGLSQTSYINIAFDFYTQKKALISDNKGWHFYPVEIQTKYENGKMECDVQIQVKYSSTCPCSAALARQLIQEKFEQDFKEDNLVNKADISQWLQKQESILATPHSQRSHATVNLRYNNNENPFEFFEIIRLLENTLKTPVQSAVKREDEQEFARLNGSNPMFCEDAARKLKNTLNSLKYVKDFKIKVQHFESLHPHDAVAITVKGVKGGLTA